MEQGSQEWRQTRCGKVTASRVSDVLSKIKTGESASRRDYKFQLVAEIMSGVPQENGFINDAMKYGTENEPFARAAYEIIEGVMVEEVSFVNHPQIGRAGASPDGYVGDSGLIEIKVPKLATHLNYLLDGVVPATYQNQMLWQMACCERPWCDFVSFRPDLPKDLQVFKIRFNGDLERIKAMELEVLAFLSEVDALLLKLQGMKK